MFEDLKTKLSAIGAGRMKEVGLIAMASLLAIALIFPHQIGVVLSKVNLLSMAAIGGYWIDRTAATPERRPHLLVGMDRSVAEMRRALIIAATMLSMALAL